MAMIHVNRSGTAVGGFFEEDVRAGLRAGRFAPTGLGWRGGMAQWQPLSQFSEFAPDIPTRPAAEGATPVPGATPPAPGPTVPGPGVPEERTGLPWENRDTRGFFNAFADTLALVLTKPGTAFSI